MRAKMTGLVMATPEQLRAALRHDFCSFAQKSFQEIFGGQLFDMNWHIEAIAYQLEQLEAGAEHRCVVTLPPRSLKSFLISVAWVAWLLGHDPSVKVIVVSYSADLAEQLAHWCRKIMRSVWYRKLFPKTRLAPDRQSISDFQTTAGGGRLSTSIGGPLTGRGGDYIIIDDPQKADDAQSETLRRTVINWITNTLFSRLDNKQHGRILLVMQRLHEEDLAGYLIEKGWPELRLAAIAPEDEEVALSPTRTYRRQKGEALHTAREPLETLLAIKADMTSHHFQAQYQEDPVPATGNMIKADWLRYYDTPPTPQPGDKIIMSLDTANEDNLSADYSVFLVALQRGRKIYVLDVVREQLAFPALCRRFAKLDQHYRPHTILIENAASGRQLLQRLREDSAYDATVLSITPKDSKIVRMDGQTDRIEGGELLLPVEADWLAVFKRELLAFPNGKKDDQVDALSQLLRHTARHRDEGIGFCEIGDPYAPFI
ncbi:MAG: phage terminase large subunit, partial [Sphingomonadaceae bacterium]